MTLCPFTGFFRRRSAHGRVRRAVAGGRQQAQGWRYANTTNAGHRQAPKPVLLAHGLQKSPRYFGAPHAQDDLGEAADGRRGGPPTVVEIVQRDLGRRGRAGLPHFLTIAKADEAVPGAGLVRSLGRRVVAARRAVGNECDPQCSVSGRSGRRCRHRVVRERESRSRDAGARRRKISFCETARSTRSTMVGLPSTKGGPA
jgi:hypothetical protein